MQIGTTKGTGGDVLILEEAAYCDEGETHTHTHTHTRNSNIGPYFERDSLSHSHREKLALGQQCYSAFIINPQMTLAIASAGRFEVTGVCTHMSTSFKSIPESASFWL